MASQSVRFSALQRKQLQWLVDSSGMTASELVRVAVDALLDNMRALRVTMSPGLNNLPRTVDRDMALESLTATVLRVLCSTAAKAVESHHVLTSARRGSWFWAARDGRAVRFGILQSSGGGLSFADDLTPSTSLSDAHSDSLVVDYVFAKRLGRCYSFGGEC